MIDVFRYKVLANVATTKTVKTLLLEPVGFEFKFLAGQYINVFIPELGTPEGKAYSISSAPLLSEKKVAYMFKDPTYPTVGSNQFAISIREIGQFSHWLGSRAVGEEVTGSKPYGYFFSDQEETNLVLFAGGIGVSPFRAITSDTLGRGLSRKVTLFHSNRHDDDMVFFSYFSRLASEFSNFSYLPYVTGDVTCTNPRVTYRRFCLDDALPFLQEKDNTEVMICGSISLVRDVWSWLVNQTAFPEESIYTEAFFSH